MLLFYTTNGETWLLPLKSQISPQLEISNPNQNKQYY
jgi:hypothetical protein